MTIYTLNFLNAFINKNSQAKIFLKNTPADNGVINETIIKKSKEPILRDSLF
jgi:hypothetical protein